MIPQILTGAAAVAMLAIAALGAAQAIYATLANPHAYPSRAVRVFWIATGLILAVSGWAVAGAIA